MDMRSLGNSGTSADPTRLYGLDCENYRWLLDVTTVAIVVTDSDGRIRLVNAEATRLFGHHNDALIGRHVEMLIPERYRADHARHREAYKRAPRARAMGAGVQLYGVRADGSEFPMEIGLTPLNTEHGFLVATTIIDVSARNRAEQALLQAQKMEAVGQLTGGIAHDFNNLLTVISGNLQLLQERLADDRVNLNLIDAAADAASRGSELIRSLLAFSRKQALNPQTIRLSQTCRRMLPILERTLGEHIAIQLIERDEWEAIADVAHFESALLNLAVNARDAMGQGGQLIIEVADHVIDSGYALGLPGAQAGDYVMLSVSDDGCGMDSETQSRALEPFFTTKASGRGSGLGLSMVFGFARQSSGLLRIYSEPGQGTTVRLFLPRAKKRQPAALPAQRTLDGYRGNEAVLVLEDDEAVGALAAQFLDSLGYRVFRARDGASALSLVEKGHTFNVLFADLVLVGELDGIEVARALLQRQPGLRVLYTSGHPQDVVRRGGRVPDNVRILPKPYDRDLLVRSIRALLDEHRNHNTGQDTR